MTKFERYERVFTWTMIIIALIWLCFAAIPQFVDRLSKRENEWVRRNQPIEQLQLLPSPKPSRGD